MCLSAHSLQSHSHSGLRELSCNLTQYPNSPFIVFVSKQHLDRTIQILSSFIPRAISNYAQMPFTHGPNAPPQKIQKMTSRSAIPTFSPTTQYSSTERLLAFPHADTESLRNEWWFSVGSRDSSLLEVLSWKSNIWSFDSFFFKFQAVCYCFFVLLD